MKKFEIPEFYRSPIISKVKASRKLSDPRKKDFSPTKLSFSSENLTLEINIARHFGFCYGVENAIEIAYKAIHENPGKKIYLLSEMIHNPGVNEDLISYGIEFIQDTYGTQIIPWEQIKKEDIVIIPAFGTTVEIENKLSEIGVDVQAYNTTCPFVEKVWNRSEKLGKEKHTIIIHGKHKHEETRATFSHSNQNAPSLIVYDKLEAAFLCEVILNKKTTEEFYTFFKGKYSDNFDIKKDFDKVGVVNQTTMLASETQEITEMIIGAFKEKYGEENFKNHIADTRDTLCYATNDNQSATLALLEENVDLAIVVGGYNSSNTSHLVELLETKFTTYYIENDACLLSKQKIEHFDFHNKNLLQTENYLDFSKKKIKIALTSGASCPDSVIDKVIQKLLNACKISYEINQIESQLN